MSNHNAGCILTKNLLSVKYESIIFTDMKFIPVIFLLFISLHAPGFNISIHTNQDNLQHSISSHTITDVLTLLRSACTCEVKLNDHSASIQLHLPEIDTTRHRQPSRFEKQVDFPYLQYPIHDYTWTSKKTADNIVLTLKSTSFQGISCGLYGLLQEQLGFLFYHPKETILPNLTKWPLPDSFEWKAIARFDKKGFHLHTQHPLELTEALMDPEYPNGLQLVKDYLDWLARNQQNYFEFNLLEGINLNRWPLYARQFVEYGQSRGIIMGVDLSLHMIQQKSFMLYQNPPNSFRSKKKQIDRRVEKLFAANWDVWNVEFSTTEFTGGNVRKKEKLQLHLTDRLTNQYGAKLMGRKHVVKASEEIGGGAHKEYVMTADEAALDKHRGILIHTVMFYTISEKKAPVYQNENLRHMLDQLLLEMKQRETWYYPESAYWITFDNSVPMLLLPYLTARLDDILLMDSLQLSGHITFSSGWEWGYWLIDWSIARWSWKHEYQGNKIEELPLMYLADLFNSAAILELFENALSLQQKYLKDENMIKYMVAMTVTDEMPKPVNLQLHPRPEKSYKWIRNKAEMAVLDLIEDKDIPALLEFSEKTGNLMPSQHMSFTDTLRSALLQELIHGIAITGLRAKHRVNTLSYLIAARKSELQKDKAQHRYMLDNARKIREEAQSIVRQQENHYRYPVSLIARKHWSHTAYNYGYLYPVSNLHFWYREEEQARKNKFGPLFMNIWDITRIIGLTE